MSKTTHIYGLIDPRNRRLFYIGSSTDPDARLRTHVQRAAVNSPHTPNEQHVRAILDANEYPDLVIIETCPTRAEAIAAEERWIAVFRASGALRNVFDRCWVTGTRGSREQSPSEAEPHMRTSRPRKSAMTPAELRAFRQKRGWSQGELARRLGVHYSTVSLWEARRRTIPETVAKALLSLDNVKTQE